MPPPRRSPGGLGADRRPVRHREQHPRTGSRSARRAAREEHAAPLLEQLKAFLDTSLNRVSGKSALAQAIRYALSRWQALTRYITDGRLEMSNNAAERAMPPPVLGRKNYLFCGSDAGGQRAAASTPSSRPPR